jgi:hypothetical protein
MRVNGTDLERLRRENAELRLERELLKKLRPSSSPSTIGKACRVIEAAKASYPVKRMGELLEVPRSGTTSGAHVAAAGRPIAAAACRAGRQRRGA